MSKLVQKPRALVAIALVIILALGACSGQSSTTEETETDTEQAQTEEGAEENTEGATDDSDAANDSSEETDSDDAGSEDVDAPDEDTDAEDASELVTEDRHGLTVGFTAEGYPFRGNPDAPITMYEYSDFQCPFCSRYAAQTEPAIDDSYVRDGTLRVVFREFPLEGLHPNARAAHVASLCVADQGPLLYWEMHEQIFRTQGEWSSTGDPESYFADLAEEAGADMEQYAVCIEGGEKETIVDAGIQDAQAAGFGGTPSFLLVDESSGDSYELVGAQPFEQFAGYIDAIAAGETPASAQQEEGGGEIPFWATAEGLSPDPDNPDHTMAGDAFQGNPDASVIVVEFSDFQCPFCQRHVTQTQPVLNEQFVDSGDVMWVFKHFPLPIHPQAPAAGAAAECAADQGKFWEMHDALFEDINRWASGDIDAALAELAAEVELDAEAFAACMDAGEAIARVESDASDGAPFVRGTPTFIVMAGEQGRIVPGALPAEEFSNFLQETLDSVAN